MITGAVDEAVALLRAGVDALLEAPVEGLDAAGFVPLLEAVEVQRRRLEAVDQRLLAGAAHAGVASLFGQPGLAGVIASLLRIDVPEARRRVARAGDLGPRRSLTGEVLGPILPAAAQAAAEGELSGAQADVIIGCLERIPASAPAAAWPVAEQVLVEAARVEAPRMLHRTAEELLARLDPDGREPAEEAAQRRRGFTLAKRPGGWSRPGGEWSPEVTAFWTAVLDSLAAPQNGDGQPDPRTPAQRRHDAMLEAARRLLASGSLPPAGGIPVTVLATTTISELTAAAAKAVGKAGPAAAEAPLFGLAGLAADAGYGDLDLSGLSSAGLARLGHGDQLSLQTLLTVAGDAEVIPVIFNDTGGILSYGRGKRLADRGQRLALAARDGGCCFPGCDRPAAWSEVHHILEWAAGGPTDIDNMCLVCVFHHRHFEAAGWAVRMADDGMPEWLPPPWLDPEQKPRRNTVHHRPDIDFRQPTTAA